MTTNTLFAFLNSHPVFFLATCAGNEPRVRAMRLYHADKKGILFNTSNAKSLHRQLQPKFRSLSHNCDFSDFFR